MKKKSLLIIIIICLISSACYASGINYENKLSIIHGESNGFKEWQNKDYIYLNKLVDELKEGDITKLDDLYKQDKIILETIQYLHSKYDVNKSSKAKIYHPIIVGSLDALIDAHNNRCEIYRLYLEDDLDGFVYKYNIFHVVETLNRDDRGPIKDLKGEVAWNNMYKDVNEILNETPLLYNYTKGLKIYLSPYTFKEFIGYAYYYSNKGVEEFIVLGSDTYKENLRDTLYHEVGHVVSSNLIGYPYKNNYDMYYRNDDALEDFIKLHDGLTLDSDNKWAENILEVFAEDYKGYVYIKNNLGQAKRRVDFKNNISGFNRFMGLYDMDPFIYKKTYPDVDIKFDSYLDFYNVSCLGDFNVITQDNNIELKIDNKLSIYNEYIIRFETDSKVTYYDDVVEYKKIRLEPGVNKISFCVNKGDSKVEKFNIIIYKV